MLTLLHGINAQGEKIYRLFHSKQALIHTAKNNGLSAVKSETIYFRQKEKIRAFWLTVFSGLQDNLSLFNSLSDAILYLSNHAPKPLQRAFFHRVLQEIRAGKLLSDSLQQAGIPLPTYYQALIQQAEREQNLSSALCHLTNHLQEKIVQKKQLRKKMIYPCLLLLATLLFFHFMIWVLLPNINQLYQSIGKTAPNWLVQLGRLKIGVIALDIAFLVFIADGKRCLPRRLKQRINSWITGLPLIRGWQLMKHRLRWLQLFTLQCQSLTPLSEALQHATRSCEYPPLSLACEQVLASVQKGLSPSQALQQHRVFPAQWVLAFQLGERNNRFTQQCQQLLLREQIYFSDKVEALLACVEPLVMALLAGLLLAVVLALYAPLLGMYGT
jgi:type II secretory pathway component PulF